MKLISKVSIFCKNYMLKDLKLINLFVVVVLVFKSKTKGLYS